MKYPRKVCIARLRDGTPVEVIVANEKEMEELILRMEEEQDRVRRYFDQYPA